MSNNFRLHTQHDNIDEWLSISNGGTTVLLTVIGLSGSIIAQSNKEKDILLWILEHDQEVRGLGNAGFDICDIPWDSENFEAEKNFLIRVIDGANQKLGWDKLDYEPNESRIYIYIDKLKDLITKFQSKDINKQSYRDWIKESSDPRFTNPIGYTKCKTHGILLYFNGCIACNDI